MLPVSRQGETNILKLELTIIAGQAKGKTAVQFNRNGFKPDVTSEHSTGHVLDSQHGLPLTV